MAEAEQRGLEVQRTVPPPVPAVTQPCSVRLSPTSTPGHGSCSHAGSLAGAFARTLEHLLTRWYSAEESHSSRRQPCATLGRERARAATSTSTQHLLFVPTYGILGTTGKLALLAGGSTCRVQQVPVPFAGLSALHCHGKQPNRAQALETELPAPEHGGETHGLIQDFPPPHPSQAQT